MIVMIVLLFLSGLVIYVIYVLLQSHFFLNFLFHFVTGSFTYRVENRFLELKFNHGRFDGERARKHLENMVLNEELTGDTPTLAPFPYKWVGVGVPEVEGYSSFVNCAATVALEHLAKRGRALRIGVLVSKRRRLPNPDSPGNFVMCPSVVINKSTSRKRIMDALRSCINDAIRSPDVFTPILGWARCDLVINSWSGFFSVENHTNKRRLVLQRVSPDRPSAPLFGLGPIFIIVAKHPYTGNWFYANKFVGIKIGLSQWGAGL